MTRAFLFHLGNTNIHKSLYNLRDTSPGPALRCMPPSYPAPQPQAPCSGPGLFSKSGMSAWSSHSWEKKNRGSEEDPPPKSRSPPGLGHLDRAPLFLIPQLSHPSVGRCWNRLGEDSPSLQVDVKHTILNRLYLLLSDLCTRWVAEPTPGFPCPQQPFLPLTGGTLPHPGSRPILQKSIHWITKPPDF